MARSIAITGAGSGLGRSLARRLADEGHTIVLLGRTQARLDAVAAELGKGSYAVVCDVASADSVRQAFAAIAARHPGIDVLINNAGIYQPSFVKDATDAQIGAVRQWGCPTPCSHSIRAARRDSSASPRPCMPSWSRTASGSPWSAPDR